jgi:hypothetical protein
MAIQTKSSKEVTITKSNGHAAVAEGLAATNGHAMAQPATGLIQAVTADELGAELVKGKMADGVGGYKESLDLWLDSYKANLVGQAERYAQRLRDEQRKSNSEVALAIGEITQEPNAICPTGYNAFDVLSFSPLELFSGPLMPASDPDKILRGTNLGTPNVSVAAHLAVVFINPVPSTPCGFTVPPTIQLGGRTLRVGFDVMNVTTVNPGLSAAFVFTLPAAAPSLIFVPFIFLVPGVATPEIYEVNVTADIIESPQPYSAFATFHDDVDTEISIFGNVGPERQHDAPNRYMIYPF